MKKLIKLTLLLSFTLTAFARGGAPETEADYIVPTSPEYVPFSRFKVEIVDRFEGEHTQQISYIFPEFLVGEAKRVITLKRIPGTENSWTSPELDAHCTVTGDDFSCNIYVNKFKENGLITAERAITHLPQLNLSEEQRRGLAGVIRSFYSHEPAGFLSYDID
ncbi:MAG: hypothetical protein K9K67_15430 [Bacteriovoracaceae bacterium]|nr:hypothetical protein [Bacteriovoracaceae bacterium]